MTTAARTGTYIAFHANGATEPTESDIKYFNLLKAWDARRKDDFHFVNSHEKTGAVRDSSKRETLKTSLRYRLNRSKNMVLVIGQTTKEDTDWIPFEITHAIDVCGIPIIATYPGYLNIDNPSALSGLWPAALASRINNNSARVIHIPFKKEPILDAIGQFNVQNQPNGGMSCYDDDTYRRWGLKK